MLDGLHYVMLVQVSDRTFTQLQLGPASKLPQKAQDILWPTLGGLGTGLIALAYPEVLYQGFGNVNAILEARGSDYAPAMLLQIVAAKVVTTSICQRSGLVGGIYAPSIFMGTRLMQIDGILLHKCHSVQSGRPLACVSFNFHPSRVLLVAGQLPGVL